MICFFIERMKDGGFFFFFQAEDGIRDDLVTGVQTCALPISLAGCDSDDGDKPRAEPAGQSAEKQQPADGAGSAARRGPVRLLRLGSFDAPTFLAAPHGDKRRFVVQRGGAIVILKGRRELEQPFLDVSDNVSTDGEGGLLSMAFAP